MLTSSSGTGKLPDYLFNQFGPAPSKFWGYSGPDRTSAEDRSKTATGSKPRTRVGMLSDSEDESLDVQDRAGEKV